MTGVHNVIVRNDCADNGTPYFEREQEERHGEV